MKLIQSIFGRKAIIMKKIFLQVWHRYEWNDRRYGQLKEVETWKRIWEIKERIEVRLR